VKTLLHECKGFADMHTFAFVKAPTTCEPEECRDLVYGILPRALNNPPGTIAYLIGHTSECYREVGRILLAAVLCGKQVNSNNMAELLKEASKHVNDPLSFARFRQAVIGLREGIQTNSVCF